MYCLFTPTIRVESIVLQNKNVKLSVDFLVFTKLKIAIVVRTNCIMIRCFLRVKNKIVMQHSK